MYKLNVCNWKTNYISVKYNNINGVIIIVFSVNLFSVDISLLFLFGNFIYELNEFLMNLYNARLHEFHYFISYRRIL